MIKVAIIDDGMSFNRLDNSFVSSEFEIMNQKIRLYKSCKAHTDSHGLIVASIINELKKIDCSFISIKVKNNVSNGQCADFIYALDMCRELDVDIINSSLGTSYKKDYKLIQSKIVSLLKKNIIVVAATSNSPAITYPAYSEKVIGVRYNIRSIIGRNIFLENSNYGVNIESAPPKYLIDKDNLKMELELCNSFTAPVITSMLISNIANNGRTPYEDTINYLKTKSYYIKDNDMSPIRKNYCYNETI